MATKRRSRYRNPEFLKALGERVRSLRIKKGYSIDRLAKETESLSPAVIYRLESGSTDVQICVLLRISETLEIPLRKLLSFRQAK